MKTFILLFMALTVLLFQFVATASDRNPLEKKFRCPICGLIQIYTLPGIYECPNDRTTMLEVIQ
jgi:hypothetical protein